MIRILVPIFSRLALGGGVGEITRMLARHAGSSGFTMTDFQGYDLAEGYPINRPSSSLKLKRKIFHLKHMAAFSSSRQDSDLVFFQTSMSRPAFTRDAVYMSHCLRDTQRYSVFIHGWNWGFVGLVERLRLRRIATRCLSGADVILVLATVFKNRLVEWGVPAAKIHVITTMIDEELFEHCDIGQRLKRLDQGEALRVLFMGRVVKQKGVHELIDAFALYQAKNPAATLTVAGDGPELENLRRRVRKEGTPNISFAGFVTGERKARILQEADVLVLPTYHGEGLPVAVLEAVAFGCAVVTRPVAGLADFVDSDMGFVTESMDPRIYQELLQRLTDRELLLRIARYNHDHVGKDITGPIVSRRIFALLREQGR